MEGEEECEEADHEHEERKNTRRKIIRDLIGTSGGLGGSNFVQQGGFSHGRKAH